MPSEPKRRHDLVEGELTRSVIGAFYYVYNELGYGFLESISEALARTLRRLGHTALREARVEIDFEGEVIGRQKVDMLVDSKLILEIKSTYSVFDADHRQLTSYLSGSRIQVGLLLHFGPEPKFYRSVHTRPRKKTCPPDQQLPRSSARP